MLVITTAHAQPTTAHTAAPCPAALPEPPLLPACGSAAHNTHTPAGGAPTVGLLLKLEVELSTSNNNLVFSSIVGAQRICPLRLQLYRAAAAKP